MHFGRNQLSRVSLGFSPLIPNHTSDWQFNNATALHHTFARLQPVQDKIDALQVENQRLRALSDAAPRLYYALVAFAAASPRMRVNLAADTHSLPRFSKRTPRHCKRPFVQQSRDCFLRAAPFMPWLTYSDLVSGSFRPARAVLFSFPSPYYCAIGLR